jgi:hypothetical protein
VYKIAGCLTIGKHSSIQKASTNHPRLDCIYSSHLVSRDPHCTWTCSLCPLTVLAMASSVSMNRAHPVLSSRVLAVILTGVHT